MEKLYFRLSLMTRMSLYLLAAFFFIWRGQLFAEFRGGLSLTIRLMCASLAILLVLVGFLHTTAGPEDVQMFD